MRGRISKHLLDIVTMDFYKKPPPQRMDSKKWIVQFTDMILNIHTEAWREYCDKKTLIKDDNSYLLPRIKNLQQASNNFDFPPRTRQWFDISDVAVVEISYHQTIHWINHAKKILKIASTNRRA